VFPVEARLARVCQHSRRAGKTAGFKIGLV
jgi:hypothetical protein